MIAVPGRLPLVAVRDAALYVTSLPKTLKTSPLAKRLAHSHAGADHGGPVEFDRLGMMQALHPKAEPVYHSANNAPFWRNTRKLVRDR